MMPTARLLPLLVLAGPACSPFDPAPSEWQVGIVTTVLPEGAVGVPYEVQLLASGGTPPYTWLLSGSQPPAGISLSFSGLLSGVPEVAGQFTLHIQASTGNNGATSELALTIKSSMVITNPAMLPEATVGVPYQVTFTVSNGVPPLTWSISGGGIPLGMSLDAASGLLSGKALSAGGAVFVLHVRSPLSNQETLKAFTLNSVSP